jgi:hypothetical protein
MILGDMNAKSTLWGSNESCRKGKAQEKLIEERELIILNSGKPTHLHTALKTFSHIRCAKFV